MGLKRKFETSIGNNTSDAFDEKRGTQRTFDKLIIDVSSTDKEVRRWAIRDLSGQELAHEAFIAQLYTEDDPSVIEALFSELSHNIKSTDATHLIGMLKSEKVQLRNGAIEFMQQHPKLFAENVSALLQDDDPDTRIFCADIIGVVAHPEALNWLHHIALHDENENVVGTALDKLAELSDASSMDILETVSARFPTHGYIQFVVTLIRDLLRGN